MFSKLIAIVQILGVQGNTGRGTGIRGCFIKTAEDLDSFAGSLLHQEHNAFWNNDTERAVSYDYDILLNCYFSWQLHLYVMGSLLISFA